MEELVVGLELERHFDDHGWFHGTITSRIEDHLIWVEIAYEDGDKEVMDHDRVRQLCRQDKMRILLAEAGGGGISLTDKAGTPLPVVLRPWMNKNLIWSSERLKTAMRKTVRVNLLMQSKEPMLGETDFEVPIFVAFVNVVKRWGAHASRNIAKGDFVAEYCGIVESEKAVENLVRVKQFLVILEGRRAIPCNIRREGEQSLIILEGK